MALGQLSLTNTFLEWLNRTNDMIVVLNGVESGSSNVANTAIVGDLFTLVSNSSAVVVSGFPSVGSPVYLDITTSTDPNDNSSSNIASANSVSVVYGLTQTAFGQANTGYGQANTAYAQADAAYGRANAAYTYANTAYYEAVAVHSDANTQIAVVRGESNTAYSHANTAYTQANTALALAQTGNALANVATTHITTLTASLGDAAYKNTGNSSGTVAAGNDDRFMPSGTLMLFMQTSAPTGWTKQTSSTYNDKALRLVTGSVSSGGSSAFSTVFGKTATDAHTLTASQMPSHRHYTSISGNTSTQGISRAMDMTTGADGAAGGRTDRVAAGAATVSETTEAAFTNSSYHSHTYSASAYSDYQGSGGSHSHNIDLRVQYLDVIVASKD